MPDTTWRILDANINRSREALRVIEEYVRFVRNDRLLSARVKQLRHRLKQIVQTLGPDRLLAGRASQSDVGQHIISPSQAGKTDPRAVFVASCKRLQEACRAIEEYAAAISPSAVELAAGLRFDAYTLEKNIALLDSAAGRFSRVRVYLLIGSELCEPDEMVSVVDDVLDAGVDCVQLREKHLGDARTLTLAETLCTNCRDKGKLFIINDRADIAQLVHADGVHVGQNDLPAASVRTLMPDGIVGVSTHNGDQVRCATAGHPTYIAVGPAFATATKPHEPVAGVEFIAQGVTMLDGAGIAHVAIGGITADNVDALIAVGVRCVAVASSILKADDPPASAAALAKKLAGA